MDRELCMSQNMIDLQFEIQCTDAEVRAAEVIEKALMKASEFEQLSSIEVSVVIVDNRTIREMNNEYRQVDRATDVLSFPLWENTNEWEESELEVVPLGDIVISLPKAKEQAEAYGHSLERELAFLATHGFLHLIGYLHDTEEQENRMFKRQERILMEIGLQR